ncbi:MAG: NAD(P)/FAD-dependent oxidoreductase [Halobacteriota archaeon]|nr:NAD(P)/FAD-dependent oxidoreductase [Halobacteriota archaeon]
MKYEVVVVGAGPTGSTAAKFLAEKGVSVLMVDKSKFPRDKICGGSMDVRILEDFKYLQNCKELIECYCKGSYIYSPSLKHKIKFESGNPTSLCVLRDKFDEGLKNLAVDAGAEFIDGNGVKDLETSVNRAEVRLEDGRSIKTEVIIGADGVRSIASKKSGLKPKWGPDEIASCVIQELNIGESTVDEFFTEKRYKHLHIRFGGIFGYGWVFPKKEHLNIGIGAIQSKTKGRLNLNEQFNDYIKTLKGQKIIPDDLVLGKCKGWPLPLKLPLKKCYADRIILCGDAAGFVNPIDGGGLIFGMYTGKIAAEVISWALNGRGTSEAYLSKYKAECDKLFGRKLKRSLLIRNLINAAPEIFVKVGGSRLLRRGVSDEDNRSFIKSKVFP